MFNIHKESKSFTNNYTMRNTFQIRKTMKKQITDALMRLQAELRNRTTIVTIVESTSYILIAAIALFGNCIVLWAVYRNSRLRSIPNYFIISLAVSDVLIAVLSTPLSSAVLVTGECTFGLSVYPPSLWR